MATARVKSIEQCVRDTEEPEHRLDRVLGVWELIGFGVAVVIGTGIFVLTGVAAATNAGPAVAVSFVISGVACGLAALCYAELASTVPAAGSAYTYSYASMGELVAWIIGWDLVLEFVVAAATVAIGWGQYFTSALESVGLALPPALTSAPGAGGFLNLPAAAILLILTGVLVAGIRQSSAFTQAIVVVKLAVVLFFIVFGAFFVDPANWTPFVPPYQPATDATAGAALDTPVWALLFGGGGSFGLGGVVAGAAVVFFAYIGFDVVATTAEETRNPKRDMPIGILGSLALCSVLYVLVSLVMTGIVPYTELNTAAPMATAFEATGNAWAVGLVSLGAIAGLTTVAMILLLGQSRVGFAMSRDGLLPPWFAQVHPRFRTPHRITIVTGTAAAVLAALTPIEAVAELTNIGTLFAFALVSAGVVVLRRSRPDLPRAFRTPLVPLVPVLAVLACVYLMLNLTGWTWIRFFAWMALGVVVYFLYGRRRSRLAREG